MERRTRLMAVALAALALSTPLSGCLSTFNSTLIIAASAPRAASGMTLFVVQDPGVLDSLDDARAEYSIFYGERLIYPPAGKGASVPFDGRSGSVFIPYNLFVVGNGDYDIVVHSDGMDYRSRVSVQKWANYVYLHPFDTGSDIRVDVTLNSQTGGEPTDRIMTRGELLVAIHYRGLSGDEDRTLGRVTTTTDRESTGTKMRIPRSALAAGPGYYSFEPLFHNEDAKNNVQVKADPTMAYRDPPWNWIYITR